MSLTAVLIDDREPVWVQEIKFGGVMTAVTRLESGDIWATTDDGTMLLFERKTVSDFLGSVTDNRLWVQLSGLRAKSPWSYLVITGLMQPSPNGKVITDRGLTGWDWSSMQGVLLKVQELGVFVVQAPTDTEFEATILRIANRSRTPQMVLNPTRSSTVLSAGEQILAALPGIGLSRLNDLLDYCGTVAWALAYLTDDKFPKEVSGIGSGIKRKVREALGLEEGTVLSVICEETGQRVEEKHERE